MWRPDFLEQQNIAKNCTVKFGSRIHGSDTSSPRRCISQKSFETSRVSTNCITMTKNPVHHARTKHVDVKYHFIRQMVSEGKIQCVSVSTKEQLADALTKSVPRLKLTEFREQICQEKVQDDANLISREGFDKQDLKDDVRRDSGYVKVPDVIF